MGGCGCSVRVSSRRGLVVGRCNRDGELAVRVVFEAQWSDVVSSGVLPWRSLVVAGKMYEATVMRTTPTVYAAFVTARVAGDPNRELRERRFCDDWDSAMQWAEETVQRLHALIGNAE